MKRNESRERREGGRKRGVIEGEQAEKRGK